MKPIYIGYFTKWTGYQYEAVECMETLDAFELEHDFVAVENRGSWVCNCAQKPEVIRRLMQKHDGRPLVYLDADARVRRYPALFDALKVDIAYHRRHGEELLSGTLYFGPTVVARRIVDAWCESQAKVPDQWDQKVLDRVLNQIPAWIHLLPAEYVRVFDDPKMGEPVIEHMQASRRYSAGIARGVELEQA